MSVAEETVDAAYDFVKALVGMEVTVHPYNQPETKLRLVQNFTEVSNDNSNNYNNNNNNNNYSNNNYKDINNNNDDNDNKRNSNNETF